MHHLPSTLSLGIAASVAAFASPTSSPAGTLVDPHRAGVAELRARGPAALDELLAAYDAARPADRDALAATIDAVAGQRYATISRLYWYTDLASAERAAHQLHQPILALRMLGDLRDDLSCANSRLFRATLYANTELSAFLRSNFVLYWSSERAVPTVTIDYGDGRKIVRTTTGNSAHYVLDEDGHVLDVLPGLFAPSVFRRELAHSLGLARKVRGMSDARRIEATARYHRDAAEATERTWRQLAGAPYFRGAHYLLDPGDADSALAQAQRATTSKAIIEVPDLRKIGMIRADEVPSDPAAWSMVGQLVWDVAIHVPAARRTAGGRRTPPPVPPSLVLDAPSRALVARLHNAGPDAQHAGDAELAAVIARLEQHIVADTALNQFTLRQQIHRRIADQKSTDFATLNAWIYDHVFATPKSDPWLGLLPRTDFTGLPGDGVVSR